MREKLETAEYNKIHAWLFTKHGSAEKCENETCSGTSRNFQWALKAGKRHEKKRENYLQLCIYCHRRYDKEHGNNGHKVLDERRHIMVPPELFVRIKKIADKNYRKIILQLAQWCDEEELKDK